MRKRILNLFLSFMFVVMSGIVLTACGTKDFDTTKIKACTDSFTYDGQAHVFEVEYDVEGVDTTVTYSKTKDGEYGSAGKLGFVNAGTYSAYYKLSAEGYNDYISSEPVEFTISAKEVELNVKNIDWMLSDGEIFNLEPSYTQTGVVGGDNLRLSFAVGNKVGTNTPYDKNNMNYSDKYELLITSDNPNYIINANDAKIIVKDYVAVYHSDSSLISYAPTLSEAYSYLANNSVIKLLGDITSDTGYIGDITLKAQDKNYKFTLDLNGHVVEAELDFINYVSPSVYTEYGINVTIIDSSEQKTGRVGGTFNDYGILVKGNNKVKVTLDGIIAQGVDGGIYSNGNCDGAVITANNSNFFGIGATVEDGTVGAYLAGNYTYTFTNCYFEGETAYYTKSGTHALSNNQFVGIRGEYEEPTYFGNGAVANGSALVIDSAQGYIQYMAVSVSNCTFDSISGYCIEVFSTSEPGESETSYALVTVTGSDYDSFAKTKPVYTEYDNVVTGVTDTNLEKGFL